MNYRYKVVSKFVEVYIIGTDMVRMKIIRDGKYLDVAGGNIDKVRSESWNNGITKINCYKGLLLDPYKL